MKLKISVIFSLRPLQLNCRILMGACLSVGCVLILGDGWGTGCGIWLIDRDLTNSVLTMLAIFGRLRGWFRYIDPIALETPVCTSDGVLSR